jgi:hypothetical protein
LFSEFPGRFVVATSKGEAFTARAAAAGVPVVAMGKVGATTMIIGTAIDLSVQEIATRRADALPRALGLTG